MVRAIKNAETAVTQAATGAGRTVVVAAVAVAAAVLLLVGALLGVALSR